VLCLFLFEPGHTGVRHIAELRLEDGRHRSLGTLSVGGFDCMSFRGGVKAANKFRLVSPHGSSSAQKKCRSMESMTKTSGSRLQFGMYSVQTQNLGRRPWRLGLYPPPLSAICGCNRSISLARVSVPHGSRLSCLIFTALSLATARRSGKMSGSYCRAVNSR